MSTFAHGLERRRHPEADVGQAHVAQALLAERRAGAVAHQLVGEDARDAAKGERVVGVLEHAAVEAAQQVAEVLLLVRADLGDVRVQARLPAAVAGAAGELDQQLGGVGLRRPISSRRPSSHEPPAHVVEVPADALEVERGTGDQEDGRSGLAHGSGASIGVFERRRPSRSWRGMDGRGPGRYTRRDFARSKEEERCPTATRPATLELEVLLDEEPTFHPPPEFTAQANANDPAIYERGRRDFEAWWESWARELEWAEPWARVLDWNPPWAKWFVDGKLNASYNCLDRHVEAGLGDRVAYHWEGEDGERRTITYADLLEMTCRFANVLKDLGVERDDRVAIYLPMVPEAPAAMLACARIGAPHSVVFGGFSAEAVKDRINDCEAKVLVTADFSLRRGKPLPMKENVDEVLPDCPSIEHCVVVRRTGGDVPWTEGRDVWWHEAMRGRLAGVPGRRLRLRADALPALHVGHDREAEGDRAHHRRLHDRRRWPPTG